ncbi:MAG TPA: NAD-dependent epimerase/dehydratase family protein, partial [Marinobacter sp.]|nr:NAD-dependent epimerase/dehydratase family protein [Marinobacter sp.]
MKAFVTGADGFIGSHLCEALRDAGHEVTGLALYNSFDSYGWLDEVEGVEKVRGDIRDAEQMRRLIKGHDTVFHLAALISVPDSYLRPRSYIDTNVMGTLNILEAARDAGSKVIHTSTSEVYGTAQYTPMDEKHPINPQSPYAASKVAADALVKAYHLSYDLPCVILRPFNTYGPRQSERAVVATIIRQALDPMCGTIELGNLSAVRDLTYVADTVLALHKCGAGLPLDTYICGSGWGWSVAEIAEKVVEITGCHKPIRETIGRKRPDASEVDVLVCKKTFSHDWSL